MKRLWKLLRGAREGSDGAAASRSDTPRSDSTGDSASGSAAGSTGGSAVGHPASLSPAADTPSPTPVQPEPDESATVDDIDDDVIAALVAAAVPDLGASNAAASPVVALTSGYLTNHEVVRELAGMVSRAVAGTRLPFTPYPALRRMALVRHERLRVGIVAEQQPGMTPVVLASEGAGLLVSDNRQLVWGLHHIVQFTSPRRVAELGWLVESLASAAQAALGHTANFDTLVVGSVTGSFIFRDSLLRNVIDLQVHLDYLLWGPSKSQALDTFVNAVVADVSVMHSRSQHIVLGVQVTSKNGETHMWKISAVLRRMDEFKRAVRAATLLKTVCCVECIFGTSEFGFPYERGTKRYQLNVVQTSNRAEDERLVIFAPYPFSSLHSGVFLSQSSATSYLAMFLPSDDEEAEIILRADSLDSRLLHPDQPSLTRLLRDQLSSGLSKSFSQDALASLDTCLFRVLLEENEPTGSSLAVLQATCCLSSSTAAKLHRLLYHIDGMLAALTYAAGQSEADKKYDRCLQSILQLVSRDTSFERGEHGRPRLHPLQEILGYDMCHQELAELRQLPASAEQAQHGLRMILSIIQFTQRHLMESVSDSYSKLKEYVAGLGVQGHGRSDFGNPSQERQDLTGGAHVLTGDTVTGTAAIEHTPVGVVEPTGFDNLVFDISSVIGTVTVARVASGLKLQYCADVRLDQVLEHYLLEVCSGRFLPKSPWAILGEECLSAMYRFCLRQTRPETVLAFPTRQSTKLEVCDSGTGIHTLPGGEAFGLRSALTGSHSAHIAWCLEMSNMLASKDIRLRQSDYLVPTGVTINELCVLSGSLLPFSTTVTMQEHFYVQDGSSEPDERMVAPMFASIIIHDVKRIIAENITVLASLHCGQREWSLSSVSQMTSANSDGLTAVLASEGLTCCKIWIEVFVENDWRYVRFRKRYLLHWLVGGGSLSSFTSEGEGFLERFLTVFPSAKMATAHCRIVYRNAAEGVLLHPNDPAVLHASSAAVDDRLRDLMAEGMGQSLLEAVQWLGVRCIVEDQLASLLSLECWRICQSLVSTLDYLASLCNDIISLLSIVHQQTSSVESGQRTASTSLGQVVNSGKLLGMVDGFYQKCCEVLSDSFFQLSPHYVAGLRDKLRSLRSNSPDLSDTDTRKQILEDFQGTRNVLALKETEIMHHLISVSPRVCSNLQSCGWQGKQWQLPDADFTSTFSSGDSHSTSATVSLAPSLCSRAAPRSTPLSPVLEAPSLSPPASEQSTPWQSVTSRVPSPTRSRLPTAMQEAAWNLWM